MLETIYGESPQTHTPTETVYEVVDRRDSYHPHTVGYFDSELLAQVVASGENQRPNADMVVKERTVHTCKKTFDER